MKLLCVVVSYVCLMQMCSSEQTDYELAAALKAFYSPKTPATSVIEEIQSFFNGSDAIKDISPQFVGNVNNILDKYQNNTVVTGLLKGILSLLAKSFDGKNSTITLATVNDFRKAHHIENGDQIDKAHLLKVLLSKQLPPNHVNGIINVILMVRRNATDDQIENTLGYLYGTEAEPMTIDNVKPLSGEDCLRESYSGTNAIIQYANVAEFKKFFDNNKKINPKVIEDISIIADKLPCSIYIFKSLKWVMEYMFEFNTADANEVEFCKLKNDSLKSLIISDERLAVQIIAMETILPTIVPDKDFKKMLNLLRFLLTKTTVKENENTFEYIYGSELYKSLGVHPNC